MLLCCESPISESDVTDWFINKQYRLVFDLRNFLKTQECEVTVLLLLLLYLLSSYFLIFSITVL